MPDLTLTLTIVNGVVTGNATAVGGGSSGPVSDRLLLEDGFLLELEGTAGDNLILE